MTFLFIGNHEANPPDPVNLQRRSPCNDFSPKNRGKFTLGQEYNCPPVRACRKVCLVCNAIIEVIGSQTESVLSAVSSYPDHQATTTLELKVLGIGANKGKPPEFSGDTLP